jgi:opine dehydrogenase
MEITILGAGHGGFATAAHLSILGHKVNIYTHPSFARELTHLKRKKEIKIKGVLKGVAKIRGKITTDIKEALEEAEVVIFVLPAFAQRIVFKEALPHLKEGQVILLTPGNYGSLELAKIAPEKRLIFLETQSLVYAARKLNDESVRISGIKRKLLAAAFPGKYTKKIVSFIKKNIFPQLVLAKNILEVSLNNPNPLLHPAITLFNLTKVDEKKEFKFYSEGVTRGVAKIIENVDKERLRVIKSLGLRGLPFPKIAFWFYRLKGTSFYELLAKSPIHKRSKGPESLEHRYIREDVPFGLVPVSELARSREIKVPTIDSIIHIASILNRVDYRKEGRNLEKLNLNGMSKKQLLAFLEKGYE